MNARDRLREKLRRARLCLIFTPSICASDPWKTLRSALAAGADMVQLREKEASSRELLALALRTRRLVAGRALFLVNDRADIAAIAGADGAHLGQDDLPLEAARHILGTGKLVGISTHSPAQARRAWKDGADYIGFGPIFPTATKGYRNGLGPDNARAVERTARGPVFLIGGIRPQRMTRLGRGHRLAASSAVLAAEEPASVVRQLLSFS